MSEGASDGIGPSTSRKDALRRAEAVLAAAGIEGPGREARFLVLGALGLAAIDVALRGHLPCGERGAILEGLLARRSAGEPVARLLGEWEFWGLPFRLSPETLVPRPDTETVVTAALAALPDRSRSLRLLDLGTGSGCLLVALLSELPQAFGLGLDRSSGALACARANAAANGVGSRAAFAAGDWADGVRGPFDLVVSNPPYIASSVIEGLDREVRLHDPRAALDGGGDGLAAYRRILAAAPRLLAPHGRIVLEIGYDQAEAVTALAAAEGLAPEGVTRDVAGRPRVVAARRAAGAA